MKPCPKGEHSVEARVRMVTDDLLESTLMISAACPYTKQMFLLLQHDPKNPMKPQPKARFGHNLDSLSYMFWYYATKRVEVPGQTSEIKPQFWEIGGA
jgi:hypothetical protein